ncbi:MAG: glycerophosphodiester phosphodiesterase [Cyclobacteriaceae bacterium]
MRKPSAYSSSISPKVSMKLFTFCAVLFLLSCSPSSVQEIDFQGHRGARGLMPENTIPGFIHALDLGVTTLEMDVVMTGDGQLLVSHEPYLSKEICLDTLGNEIGDSLELNLNIFKMRYEQIQRFDCGIKDHPRFKGQQKMQVSKPLLKEVVTAVETYVNDKNLASPNYNIEIKSMEIGDGVYHPHPQQYSELAFKEIDKLLLWDRVTIQSFDFRVLQHFHKAFPEVRLVQLVENDLSFQENIDSLGFNPYVYSCYFPLISREIISQLHARNIKVIPWTVNEVADMKRLLDWGVDGLISDYPNRYLELR